jgi:hypothetical protein
MPIPQQKMSGLWDVHLARLSYFCKRSSLVGAGSPRSMLETKILNNPPPLLLLNYQIHLF